jgi:SAM-dependent methyltransferase
MRVGSKRRVAVAGPRPQNGRDLPAGGGMSDYTGTDNLEVMAEAVNYNAFLHALVAARARPGDRILDFGAGIGTFARELARHGHVVTCLEPDAAQARRLLADGMPVVDDLAALPDASLDYVYTLNVLEHIDDDAAAVRGIAAKLKPGGRLLVYVPAFQVLYSSMDRKVGHVRRYRRAGLERVVRDAGLGNVAARYVDSLGFLAALAYRFVGSDDGTIDRRALRTYDRFVFPPSRLLDRIVGRWFGKNVLLTAEKPG